VAVSTAAQLTNALNTELSNPQKPADLVIMAAAVADFRPIETHASKLSLTQSKFHLEVEKTPDILGNLGSQRGAKKTPVLVGFATETGELETLLENLRSKMHTKKVDMMVGNLAEAPHELDADRVWIIDRHGHEGEVSTTYKSRLANRILDSILKL
jgi:phosphopantothenoylcysteine decarboxylase/phosphopantothenate--cysteine ligase